MHRPYMGDQFGLHENVRLLHEQIEKLSSQCKYSSGHKPDAISTLVRVGIVGLAARSTTISHRKRRKERTVDALALGGDEGRGKLR